MSVISKKSFLNKADKQQSNWEQTTGQEAGGVLNKQDFIRQAQSAAQQRRQAQEQKTPQRERNGFDRTATPASIAGLGAPAPTSQRQKERYNQEIGQYGVGNIDLYNRPQYRNADGSVSTVDSTSFNIQGKEVLLPSVWMKDGKAYRSSDGDEILQHFYDTGEFLGVFDTVDAANSYAEKLHDAQDYYYTTQREKALDETVAHDQLQGMKRTLAILESQKKQEQAQQPGILSMLGKASDSTLPTFQAESAQSETDRRIQELQDEIDRQESESQMQGTKRPETYTAKNVGRYKDRLIALASVPGVWTKRQKQEAEEIIGTQSGFGGLLGYEQNVTAFAPYQEAMRKGDTEAAKQWQQIYDVLYTRLYSKQTAVASGLQEGLGVTSAAAAVGKLLGANEDEYHRQMENAQRAQAEHPVLAGGAKIAGSLALMSGIGEAAGAGLAAAGMNTGGLGFKVAAGALSFAGADAVHNAGAAAMGDMSTGDYLKHIAISGAQGMAGNLAGGLVGTGLANVLRDTHKMTPFMEFLRQTASGVTNASVNQAVGYLAADEKPTKEEIATNLVTAFAFSVLNGAINSYQTTQQQKAQMNQAYQAIEQGYRAMTAGTENMTPEAKAQRAQFIMQQTQSLRESVNSYYIAGQQKAVDNLNETLDLIDEAMRAYVNGYTAASSAMQTPNVMLPGGGSTGQLPTAAGLPTTPTDPQMQKQVEQELQTAIQQGLQQAQAGTQNTPQPESGQALQNGNAAAAAAQAVSGQTKTASGMETGTGLVPMTQQAADGLAGGKNNIIAKTKNDIVKFVRQALGKKGGPERLYMGTIPDTAAAKVLDATGVDVTGYTAILPGDSVQHIFKQHGNEAAEAARGQAAVSEADVALIPDVLSNPDNVTLSEKRDALGRPVLLFSKQIGNEYVTAQAVTDGRHALTTNSLWKKSGKNPPAIRNAGETGPEDNVRNALLQGSSLDTRVAQKSDPVKPGGVVLPTAEQGTAELPTVQTEQTTTPLQRLEAMGVSGKRAQSMARGIEAFYRGEIQDGEVLSKLLSFPEVQNVMRQMTDADIEAVVSGNAQAQNPQPVDAAAQQTLNTLPTAQQGTVVLPTVQQALDSQAPGVQNGTTTSEGGMNNGTEQLQVGQRPGAEQPGEQLPDGDGGRVLGESTGGQSGILAEGRPQRAFNQVGAAAERKNLGRTLRLEKVSSQSLGLPNGTEEREIQIMPESHWDAQMQQTAQRISYETGKPVTYVLGSIRIRQADGSVSTARGVYTENGIIIQADHLRLNIDQIADHEAFHDYAANNPGLVRQIEQAIVERYGREEFDAIMDKYLKNLRGVYDLPEHASGQEVAEAYGIVKEEICADAYAGINFFGAHAEKYRSEAQAVLRERKITTPGSETEEAVARRTGPPERYSYSYGGVNANTADQKTLARAQELQMQGEDDERVRKETGWHTGMEGKLRFEIDDSNMKYHRGGDAAFSRNHPDYAEYQKLVDKMLTGSAEAWKPEDQERLQELDKTWGREYGRLSERVESGNATLEDVIDHEELFQAYPQLRSVRVEFKELPGNTQGYFSPSENKIALDSKLRSAPEVTIIHEIQHAIQKAEGFASGASPEYWQQHRDEAKEARIADIREEIARLEEQLPWDLNRWTAEDDAIEAKIGELEDSIIDIQNGVGLDSYDLYRNTAGEIEARDAASRRELTPEQRRATPPARADENTVYADLSDSLDYVGKTDDGTEVYETSEAVRKLPYKKRMEAFMDIMRNEYAGRTAKFTARDGEVYYATFDENDLRKNVYGDKKSSPRGWKAKINTGADGNIFDLVENAEHSGSGKEQGKTSEAHQGLTGWEYFVKTVQIDGRVYDLLANVRKKPDGEFVYSIQLNENEKKAPAPPRQYQNGTAKAENRPVRVPTDASEASVAEKRLPVKARFSMDEPVEQTQDLMAIHNLDGKKMDSMLQLGAIPSPSVAIVKASQGHTQYGDYTLVFPRQSIDPQADRRNKVYGADAWTPTAANAIVEREVNYEARRAAEQKIAQLANQVAGGIFSRDSVIGSRVDEVSTMDEAELAKELSKDDTVRAAYLAEQGQDIEPVLKEKVWDSFGNQALQDYTEKIGAQELAQLYVKLETGDRLTDAELETARGSIMEAWIADHEYALSRRPELRETRIARQRDKISDARVEDFIRNAEALYEDGGQTRDGVDRYATQDNLREAVDDADVEAWVRGQLRGVLGEPGIYNGKERFTASGRRRSFRETHGAYTAENIVKAMNKASARGESYWGVGAKGILSVATPRYKSVDAIHADESRLQKMPEEEYNRLLQALDKRIEGIVADVQKTAGSYDMDEIAGLLMENAGQDAMRIQQAFSRQGYAIDGGLATEIAGMYRQAAEMPTGYFEAKPQRVVTFDEPVCIAPDNCPPERLEKMKAAGLNVIEYEAGNDEQRMEIARSLKGMRFSVDEPQAETGGEIGQAPESAPAKQEQKEKKPRKKNETKPVAESLPIIAKRNLRQDMQGIFSIPEGRRAEINQIIDGLADRMLKNGELTQEDRDAFFDRMYAEGVMEVAADEYLQQARSEIAGRRIYVPESVKHEFGDDWGYFRKKAFAAGVMLVNDTSAAGIDMVNAELADTLPGMFNADDLDSREILENIVQTAEEGKSQNMSLAQYTALLAGQEYVSEDEVLDNIERQMDEALRTFTRTAKLEVHLRDRTGVKIAQEREKSAAARQREALSRAKERQQRKEMSQRQREYRELKEQQKKTLKALQWLAKNQYRAPEELQETWDEVLGDLDIYAVSAANEMRYSKKYDATWKDLAEMYKDAQANDPNFLPSKELEKIVHRLDNKKIADMDLNALQDLYKAAVGLRTEFYNRNNVINDDMNRLFAEVYTDSKKELDFGAQTKAGEAARQGKKLDSLFNQEQLSPMNVMQRMAGWNPNSAWYSMAKQLEKGERDIRDYTVSATKQLREFLTEHEDWAKKADGQGDDGIWYEVKIPQLVGALEVGKPPKFGDTITVWMTPTQKVHMYLESKSVENLRHMEGGRTFADKTLYSQGKRREAFAQGKTVRMAPETVKAIVGSLTPEEQELAQALEQYYNVFAKKEINRVSNILYGYDKAVSKNYTPIYTNSNYTKSELGVYDATAEGVGNLKSRQFSKNPSYNIGAFDAFERHVEQTARFVGMAIPARNWQTLLNWRERENSMADIITHDWGDESLKYIQDLVQTLQGGAASTRDSVSMGAEKIFSNYIGAVFGANPSIVFKQLGSIPLAGAWLDFKNFPSPGQVKRIDRSLIEKYTQELDWRTLGYSTPETKQLKENPNWTQTNKFTSFVFGGGAITAMDGWAASVLWPWAENKVRAEFPELETGSQEQIDSGSSPFYQKVAEVFNEAVARSQSTSDEMHQGTLRKSKNPVTRAFTMFKSDSSQTYNALRQRAGEAEYYKRIGDTENYNKAKRGLGVAFLAAVGGYIWAQGIEFLMNLWKRKGKAYRDEEGNLTAGSVAKEMALGLAGDLAGIVTYGEELADVIGNVLTGDKWYGIDTPGLEQLSDVVETIVEQGQNGLDVLKDAADVVKNGGSLGEYLHRNSGDIVGGIKDLAAAAATYLPGISVNNLEAYLLGTVRWASPELAAAYDDALATANKNQMKGLRGAELERKISDTLHNRRVETDEATNKTLASLYEGGFTKAVPSDTPGSISVDGEERKLLAYQKQVYDKTWSGAIGSRLRELAASDVFQAADDETREKMLSGLYEYAGEKAKAAVFDDYEVKTSTQKADDVLASGAEMADYLELKLAGAVDKYLDAIDGGLDTQNAKDVALGMAELAPEEGKKTVSDVQKWRAAIDAVDGADAQRNALLAVMKDSTKQKYEIADSYGIEARTWVQLKEILPQFDEDGNGSYKGEEIENAIDALNGHGGIMLPGGDGPQQLTNEMRAVLWQLFTGSKSAKNNPYSERVGSQVIAEREKAKQED